MLFTLSYHVIQCGHTFHIVLPCYQVRSHFSHCPTMLTSTVTLFTLSYHVIQYGHTFHIILPSYPVRSHFSHCPTKLSSTVTLFDFFHNFVILDIVVGMIIANYYKYHQTYLHVHVDFVKFSVIYNLKFSPRRNTLSLLTYNFSYAVLRYIHNLPVHQIQIPRLKLNF